MLRSLHDGPPLRRDLPPDKAECARACDRDGWPFPPGWCDWTGYDLRTCHHYAVAYYTGWLNTSPAVRAAAADVLRDPAAADRWRDLVAALDATSRQKSPHSAHRGTPAMTSVNAGNGGPDEGPTHGYGGSTTRRTPQHVADPETVLVLEIIARTVRAAGGRRDLPAAEWADRCAVSTARLSKVLTDYAAHWGLTVRRYRTGHANTNMIEISRAPRVIEGEVTP